MPIKVESEMYGHKVISFDGGKTLCYADDGEPIDRNNPRPCPRCHMRPGPDGHDPCIANLPGVAFACCGHGVKKAYVKFESGIVFEGEVSQHYSLVHNPNTHSGYDIAPSEYTEDGRLRNLDNDILNR